MFSWNSNELFFFIRRPLELDTLKQEFCLTVCKKGGNERKLWYKKHIRIMMDDGIEI